MKFFNIQLIVTILIAMNVLVTADLGTYSDTNSEILGDINLNLASFPTIYCELLTSSSYLGGTLDSIYITFIGTFSNSGPHKIGDHFSLSFSS